MFFTDFTKLSSSVAFTHTRLCDQAALTQHRPYWNVRAVERLQPSVVERLGGGCVECAQVSLHHRVDLIFT